MFKPLSVFIATRYIRSQQRKGFAKFISASSTLGIGLGVCVLIVMLSAMNGFERELANKLLSIVPHAELIAVNEPIKQWQKSAAQAKQNNHVLAVAPVIKADGLLQHGKQLKGINLRGVDVTQELKVSAIEHYISAGSWQGLTDQNTIVIGRGIAQKLSLSVGDQLSLLLPRNNDRFEQHFTSPKPYRVKVVGIFTFGGVIDDSLVYTNLTSAANMLGLKAGNQLAVHGIRLTVDNVYQAPQIARQVAYQFDHYVYIYDWTRSQGHLFNDIQLVRMVMLLVLVLVIAVASFNIVSSLVMQVKEKQADIAILISMGATRATLVTSVMLQGVRNGLVGTAIGGVLGVILANYLAQILQHIEAWFNIKLLSSDVYFIDHIPSQLQSQDVIVTCSIAIILSVIASLYPAWRATKILPAEVLGQQ